MSEGYSVGDEFEVEDSAVSGFDDQRAPVGPIKIRPAVGCLGRGRRIAFTLFVCLGAACLLLMVFGYWALGSYERRHKQKCANNLRLIGVAMIAYSNDYRFFPHMQAHQTPNSATDIAKVYRTLIYFKYIDAAEIYICPSSEDISLFLDDAVYEDPKQFAWKSEVASGQNTKPILSPPDPDLFTDPDFHQLSYTYRRASLRASSARSDTLIAADKAVRLPFDASDKPIPENEPVGNHSEGFNVLFGDGHVNFVSSDDEILTRKIYQSLRMYRDKPRR